MSQIERALLSLMLEFHIDYYGFMDGDVEGFYERLAAFLIDNLEDELC